MPLVATRGAASAQGFGEFAQSAAPVYIEDVFSTYLYTGNGSNQTITNGIDLAGKGGMVWIGRRNTTNYNVVTDTVRGANYQLNTYLTNAQSNPSLNWVFNADGFSQNNSFNGWNASGASYCAWTFRKQPKFFDVVTYTGNGAGSRSISHSLGSAPGCVIIKATSTTSGWGVWHRGSGGATDVTGFALNTTAAAAFNPAYVASTMTATTFDPASVFADSSNGMNVNGVTYVAYLFAHNAGGFGLTGTDNVISCGSATSTGSGTTTVNLGYEPQWILIKGSNAVGYNWNMFDNMRGMGASGTTPLELNANLSNAEGNGGGLTITSTGFTLDGTYWGSADLIYIAIRRGPMKTPTSGTSVFVPTAYSGNGSTQAITAGFPVDMSMFRIRGSIGQTLVNDRLRGVSQRLFTDVATGETGSVSAVTSLASNTSVTVGANGDTNSSGQTYVSWMFRRAPSYFDEICYTGTGALNAQQHNLGVAPELVITKSRSGAYAWSAYVPSLNINIRLDSTAAGTASAGQVSVSSTAVTYSAAAGSTWNGSGSTYVAYLFASCPGVSKVGSYTGTGALQNINCGFSGSARFVLIKRTDSTSNWFVWDTARGMVAGTDPSLSLNTTAAEVNANSAYTNTGGFQLLASPAADINTNGGTYIYLAIA